MRRYLIPIFILSVVFLGGMMLLLNTTWISMMSIPQYLGKNFPAMKIESLKVERQTFLPPNALELHNIALTVEQYGITYEILIPKATVDDLVNYLKLQKQVALSLQGADIRWGNGAVEGLNIKLRTDARKPGQVQADGILSGKSFRFARYQLNEFTGRVRGTEKKWQVFDLSAKGYGGTFTGQIDVQFSPLDYIFYLEFSGLNGKGLATLGESFFSMIHGEVEGTLRMIGNETEFTLLAVNMEMPKGGTLDAPLMRRVAEEYADSQQKEVILSGLQSSSSFPVEKAILNLHSTNDLRSVCSFHIENKAQNLFLIRSVNMKLDKGFRHFLLQEDWKI